MKIGVIGGNGVAATNRLCDIVERQVTSHGAFRDAHHPEMIIWQATQAPSRSMFLEGKGPNWIPDYIEIARRLKSVGCDIACMCCNTAHYAIDEISQESGLPFINLLNEVAKAAKKTGLLRFELFCSDGARKHDIYRKSFQQIFPESELIYPDAERQSAITKIICAIKTKARFDGSCVRNDLYHIVKEAKAPVIFGCTDLSVVCSGCESAVRDGVCVDSLEILANVIVDTHIKTLQGILL